MRSKTLDFSFRRITLWLVGGLLLLNIHTVIAQNSPRYLVLFKDKEGTPFTTTEPESYLSKRAIERRQRQNIPVEIADLPVNPNYIAAVENTGAVVLHSTKWFNGVVVSASETQIQAIRLLPFFSGIERDKAITRANYSGRTGVNSNKFGTAADIDYGNSGTQLEMLGVPSLHKAGYSGNTMLIGVFDSGFTRADQQGYLSHLFSNGKISDTYDFISRDTNVFDDHNHGLQVLSVMASKLEGSLVGPAFDATYALYRTENASNETPYEEVSWLLAAERADSLGVDIINTSLGYYDFDDATLNYTQSQMDGRTTIISKAARFATRTGMLIVVSAGNEGNSSWRYITAPADVDSVLTVGAITSAGNRSPFSSFGPNSEGTIKPDVVALGSGVRVGTTSGGVSSSNGTSFSSPLIASFAALLWELHPNYTAQEIASLIRSLGSQADKPDTTLGYGLPYYGTLAIMAPPINFTANQAGQIVHFSWEYDQPAAGFEIERSSDGQNFTLLASTTEKSYVGDTLTVQGSYQYRVRAITSEQNSAYSYVASVVFTILGREPSLSFFKIWPNPCVGNEIHFELPEKNVNATVKIISMTGQTLSQRTVHGLSSQQVTVSIGDLKPGIYFLTLETESGENYKQKFVKI